MLTFLAAPVGEGAAEVPLPDVDGSVEPVPLAFADWPL